MVTTESKPIILLGFMGSGKSTLGKQVAHALGWTFLDLDRFIETEENRPIPEIFEQDGESGFRHLETEALKKILVYPRQVIAVGGGAPCVPQNLRMILDKSVSVYLKVSSGQLQNRLSYSSTSRPLLKGKSESGILAVIMELMAQREPFYNQADFIIESDQISVEMILNTIAGTNPRQK